MVLARVLCLALAIANGSFAFAQEPNARDSVVGSADSDVDASRDKAEAIAAPGISASVLPTRDNAATTFPGYRFWMAPESSIDHWPWGENRYFPISIADFDAWTSARRERRLLQEYSEGLRFPGVVSTLRLSASLVGDALEGEGTLDSVAYPIDGSVEGANGATPPFQSINVAASFSEDESVSVEDEPATYPDGNFYLPNAESKSRGFRWSKRGKTDSGGNLYYDFNFQSALRTEMILSLPPTDYATVSGGIALPVATSGVANEERRVWRACFGSRSKSRLTIVRQKTSASDVAESPVGYRQESTYRVSLSGVEATTRFDFERVPPDLAEVELSLEPPLAPLTFDWGATPTTTRPFAATVSEDGSIRARVRVPASLVGDAPAVLRVSAFCPIWFGERRLPAIRLEGTGLEWRETIARLAVAEPLIASSIELENAAQAREASRSRADGQSHATFKLFSPDGNAKLTLRRAIDNPAFDSATECFFAVNEISAKTTLFFNFDETSSRRVVVPLAPGWDVDSVQSSQQDAFEWSRDADDSGRRTIRLVLKKQPVPNQSTRATLAARFVASAEVPFPVDRLCPLDLQNALRGAHALVVRTDSSSQIRFTTASGKPFAISKASPDFVFNDSLLRDAAPISPGGERLWLGDQTVGAYASLESARSSYAAELSGVGSLEEDRFLETWRLHCEPTSGMRVDRIVFYASPGVAERGSYDYTVASGLNWSWSTSTAPERRYDVALLSREDAEALRAPRDCDVYEIRLATSRSVPFDLNLFCEVPATQEIQVPLIFLPDFVGNSVEFVVESDSNHLFKTRGESIVESTVPTTKSENPQFYKKAFRYDPTALFGAVLDSEIRSDDEDRAAFPSSVAASPQVAPTIPSLELSLLERSTLGGESGDVLPLNSLCWFENYDSYYQTDGVVRHRATFFLENRGRDSFRIELEFPPNRHAPEEGRADDFLKTDPWRDEAYGRSDFFTGALDASDNWEYVGGGEVFDSINAVWADGERAPWTLWKLPTSPGQPERYVVDARLLAKRRYARVELEYRDAVGKRLSGSRRVKPLRISCDAPSLSGAWNVWLPPQFQTRETSLLENGNGLDVVRRAIAFADSFFFRFFDKDDWKTTGERAASRLGDDFALRMAIGKARRSDAKKTSGDGAASRDDFASAADEIRSETKGSSDVAASAVKAESTTAELDALRLDEPTWGDVFGSPALASALFAPEVPDDAETDGANGSSELVEDSAFGKLEKPERPTRLLIDRYALASVGVSPKTPLPNVDCREPKERANRLLEASNIKLLVVAPDLVLVTTNDALTRLYGVEFAPLCGSAICAPSSRAAASRMRDEILAPEKSRFLEPAAWRALPESGNPWVLSGYGAFDGVALSGWNYATIPLGRSEEGVYIVNRYVLVALEFFGLIGFIVLFWRRNVASPRFLLGFMGVCVAIMCPSRYEFESLAQGAFLGALCLFLLRAVRAFVPSGAENGVDARSSRGARGKDGSRVSPRIETPDDEESVSSDGCVDFARMSPEEYHYIQTGGSDVPYSRDGGTTAPTLVAIAAAFFATLAACAFAQSSGETNLVPRESRPLQPVASGSSDDGTKSNRSSQAPGSLDSDASASTSPTDSGADASAFREPYRVFVPIDENQKTSGKYYWVESELYDVVRSDLREQPRKREWRIVDAVYRGVVNHNAFSGATSIFNLKATYTVAMDSSNATIRLPAVQLASDGGARFDKQTIPFSYSEDGSEICFDAQTAPGAHTLELSIVPPQFFETTSRISIPVLPVLSARLELDVSVDAPELDAPGAFGKIERAPRRFTAELGPVDQLVIAKVDASETTNKPEIDAEQYFLMRPRATQTDVRAAFRCQALGGKVQALEIECDPSYTFSGYCKCDAGEIESVDSPTTTNPAMRVTFKRPVAGAFTVNVDFVARAFSGIGRAPFPRVAIRGARIVKNLLALAPDSGVECSSTSDGSIQTTAFPTTSSQGAQESNIVAVYDLDAVDRDASVDIRLALFPPKTTETTTCVFGAAFARVALDADVESDCDLFRLQCSAPKPFVVDSVSVSDESGAAREDFRYCLTEDGIQIDFDAPLRGKYLLKISGRTKRQLDRSFAFPMTSILGAARSQRVVRVYCSPNVALEWENVPSEWTPLDPEFFAKLGEEPQDARPVEVFAVGSPASSGEDSDDDAGVPFRDAELETPNISIHLNAPTIVGLERLFLYPDENVSDSRPEGAWKAAYQLRFQVTKGRLDQIFVAADDLYALDPMPSSSIFSATETTTSSGLKAICFQPKHPLRSDGNEIELFFSATFKNGSAGVRLPRFQTLSSSVYEDYSGVARAAYLAALQGKTPISWTIRNMRRENDPRLEQERARGELVGGLTQGARSMAMNGAVKSGGNEERADDDSSETRASKTRYDAPFPIAVEQASRFGAVYFSRYALGEDASARLSTQSDRAKADLALYEFFVNERREIFGNAVFMIKPGASERCVVVIPPGYQALEARVNGSRRLVERAPDDFRDEASDVSDEGGNERSDSLYDATEFPGRSEEELGERDGSTRWFVELDSTPYVKRLELSFQSSGALTTGAPLFKALRRRSERFEIRFPQLESADVDRVVWICAFEDFDSARGDARWTVSQRSLTVSEDGVSTSVASVERVPASVDQAGPAMRRIGLEDAASLLDAYESDSAQLVGAGDDELQRMRARWRATWKEIVGAIAPFMTTPQSSAAAATLSEPLLDALVVANNGEILPSGRADANFPVPNWSPARIAEIESKRVRVFEAAGFDAKGGTNDFDSSTSSQSLWALRNSSYSRALLGSTNERVQSVEIVVKPKTFDFLASPYAAAIFVLMATAAVVQLLDANRRYRGIRSLTHVSFMFVWCVCFFLLGWTLVALVGAFLLAVAPFAWDATRNLRRGANETSDFDALDSSEVDPQATTIASPIAVDDESTDAVDLVEQDASRVRALEDSASTSTFQLPPP